MWHVSTSWQTPDLVLLVSSWSADQRAESRRRMIGTLTGVGDAPDFWHEGQTVVHLRRRLTPAEMDLLPAGWLAIPAVHTGGGEDRLTDDWS